MCRLGDGDFCSKMSSRGVSRCVGGLGSARVVLEVFGELRVLFIGVLTRTLLFTRLARPYMRLGA